LNAVYICQKSLNFTYAFKCYQQNCSWLHFTWPTLYMSLSRRIHATLSVYTKLNVECDQHATVLGRLLTTLRHVHFRQVLSTIDRRLGLSLVCRTGRRWMCCGQIFYVQSLRQSAGGKLAYLYIWR